MSVVRYDKETLGPGSGRGSGVKAWMRWNACHRETLVKIKGDSSRYLNSYAKGWTTNGQKASA